MESKQTTKSSTQKALAKTWKKKTACITSAIETQGLHFSHVSSVML